MFTMPAAPADTHLLEEGTAGEVVDAVLTVLQVGELCCAEDDGALYGGDGGGKLERVHTQKLTPHHVTPKHTHPTAPKPKTPSHPPCIPPAAFLCYDRIKTKPYINNTPSSKFQKHLWPSMAAAPPHTHFHPRYTQRSIHAIPL